jgi:hypothetical protein
VSENKDGRHVSRIAEGGADNHGQLVRFVFEFEDGTEEGFRCNHEDMSKVIHYLVQFSGIAERARSALPGQDIQQVTPHHVVDTATAIGSNKEGIAIRFLADEGFPVDVAMRLPQIEKLIRQLNDALEQFGSSYDRRS